MKLPYFTCYILALAVVWSEVYFQTKSSFNGIAIYKMQTHQYKKLAEQRQLEALVAQDRLLDFQQNVATLMPEALKKFRTGVKGYEIRNLASVTTESQDAGVQQVISQTLFDSGKSYFRKHQYEDANRVFAKFIQTYDYSIKAPEAYFLWAEGLYQVGDLEKCIQTVQTMIRLFPENPLTGFAMVRLGRVYEQKGRVQDAVDIYKTVLRSYPQRDVASAAKASLQGMDL